MRTSLLLACVGLLGGCDLVFRLDHLDPPSGDDDGGGSGMPVTVMGTFNRHSLHNNANRIPFIQMTTPASTAHAVFANGTAKELALGADGSFTFVSPDKTQPYSLTFTTDLQTVTYQLTSSMLSLIEENGGRDVRMPVPANTQFYLDLLSTHPIADGTHQQALMSTGIWTLTPLNTSTIAASRMDWGAVQPMSGPIGLLGDDGTGSDVMYYGNYVFNGTYSLLTDFGFEPHATTAPSSDNRFGITAYALTPSLCTKLGFDVSAEASRLSGLTSNAGVATTRWWIVGAPANEMLPEVSVPIVYRANGPTPMGNVAFPTFDAFASYAELDVNVTGAPALHTVVATPAVLGCVAPTVIPAEPVKVPTEIAVGGTLLTANGQQVAADPAQPIPVTWTPSATGEAHYYVTKVLEGTVVRATIITVAPVASIPAGTLVAGHAYTLRIAARIGAPNAATGDFTASGSLFGYTAATTTTFQL